MDSHVLNQLTVVLATGNPGKVRELQTYFDGFAIEFKSQKELAVSSVAETGTTFVENAIIKARHAEVAPVCRHWQMILVWWSMHWEARRVY